MIMIRNGLIITQDSRRRVFRGNVLIDGDTIEHVGQKSDRSDAVIDADGSIVMPGLINMHTHVGMTSLRGMVDCSSLESFLKATTEFDKRNTRDMIKKSAQMAMEEMIATGTTSFLDLYYSEDAIAEVSSGIGMRAFLSWAVLDREYTTQRGNPLSNAEYFIRNNRKGMVTPSFGLQGVYACSKDTIASTEELAAKHGTLVHMHLAETMQEVKAHMDKHRMGPVAWMHKNGFLSKDLVAAHGVWIDSKERRMLASSGTTIVNNPISNARLNSGTAEVKSMIKNGINVTLGTDSAASNDSLDMFQTMKFSALINRLTAQEALDAATVKAGRALGCNMGSIEDGRKADVIVLSKDSLAAQPSVKTAVNIAVFAAQGKDVGASIINGRIVK